MLILAGFNTYQAFKGILFQEMILWLKSTHTITGPSCYPASAGAIVMSMGLAGMSIMEDDNELYGKMLTTNKILFVIGVLIVMFST